MMITEALVEIKTLTKRIEKKREFIKQFLARQEGFKDPLEKDGGSAAVIARERQSMDDLEDRIVELRLGIQRAHAVTALKVGDKTKTIAAWLIWRRDVAPLRQQNLAALRSVLVTVRDQAKCLYREIEALEETEETLDQLDGQLSLLNATVAIVEAVD